MASNLILQDGGNPTCTTFTCNTRPDLVELWRKNQSDLQAADGFRQRRIMLSRKERVAAFDIELFFELEELFPTDGASILTGYSVTQMRKWRQRGQGPCYYQYGDRGPVLYSWSHLKAFKLSRVKRDPSLYADFVAKSTAEAVVELKLFDISGAAVILGVSTSELKKWRRADVGPSYFQFGFRGSIVYSLPELSAFMAEHLVIPENALN